MRQFLVLTCVLLLLLTHPVWSQTCTHYASPSGGGDGSSTSSPFQITNFWSVASPGATLCLLDGIYTGANSMINPSVAGTAGNPITIRALNDGKVLLDGEFARRPVYVGAAWITIDGINAANAGTDSGVVEIGDGGDNVIVRRVIAWGAGSAACGPYESNAQTFNVYHNTNVLLEDVAAWGCGRKLFGRIGETHAVFRRCFGLKTYESEFGGVVTTATYKSADPITENCIGSMNYDAASPIYDWVIHGVDHYCGYGSCGCDCPEQPPNGAAFQPPNSLWTVIAKGNIAYFKSDTERYPTLMRLNSPWVQPNNVPATSTVRTISDDLVAIRRPGPFFTSASSNGCPSTSAAYPCPVTGVTASFTETDPDTVHNGTEQYTVDHFTDSSGTLGSGTHTTESGNKTIGQFVNSDLLQLAASTRPPFGAWLRYRYVNGTLTNQELWPWPMNQRIKDAMVQSGQASKGGLDGTGETDLTKMIFDMAGSAAVTPPSTQLLAWWKYDGDTGTTATDSSGSVPPNTGTLATGAAFVAGYIGSQALQLNGATGYMSVVGLLGLPPVITLETWFRADTAPTSGAGALMTLGDHVTLWLTASSIYSLYYDGTNHNQTVWNQNLIGPAWHHVVGVFSPGVTVTLYVDGVLRATGSFTAPIVYTGLGQTTYLGRHGGDTNRNNFGGLLDDTRIYNYALPPADILAHYQAGSLTPRVTHHRGVTGVK